MSKSEFGSGQGPPTYGGTGIPKRQKLALDDLLAFSRVDDERFEGLKVTGVDPDTPSPVIH